MAGVDVGTAYLTVVPSAKGFAGRLQREVGGGMNAAGSKAGKDAADGFSSRFTSGVKSAARAGAIALGGLGALGVAGAKFGLEVAAGNEQAAISFTTMLGSAQKAQAFLGKLQKFAAATPFEFPELQTAASSLISAGINADKVIPIMRTLGDVTSGMGTGSEGVQRATIALQQMSAAGRITGEDLNQLRDAGIPVYDLLSKATGKSKEKVVELAQAGKLGKKELGQMLSALESGKGLERFSGLMDKQSQSLTGLISTFKDTLGQGLANAVQPLIPLIKDGLGAASAYLATVLPKVSTGLVRIVQGVKGIAAILGDGKVTADFAKAFNIEDESKFADFLFSVRDGANTAKAALAGVVSQIKGGGLSSLGGLGANIAKIWEQLQPTLGQVPPLLNNVAASMPGVSAAVDVASKAFQFIADHIDLVVKAMPFLLSAFAAFKALQIANNAVGKDSLIGFGLQTAATIALAVSNRALAKSLKGTTLATVESAAADNVSALTRARTVAATIAHAVAEKAAAAGSKIFAAGQWLVNAALTANPIGLVVVAIGALVAALIYAYQNSETFRSYVSTAFSVVKIGALELVKVAVTAFQFLANVWLTVVGVLIDGAANAFGWVPGIGPKLQGLQKDFHTFKDSANKSLDGIRDDLQVKVDTEKANIELEALHREFLSKGWTVTAEVNTRMVYGGNGQLVPAHASGGAIGPGLHVVGDNPDGSWNSTTELLGINGAGHVYNQAQIKVAPAGSGGIDYDRLAYAISQIQVKGDISPRSLDRAWG